MLIGTWAKTEQKRRLIHFDDVEAFNYIPLCLSDGRRNEPSSLQTLELSEIRVDKLFLGNLWKLLLSKFEKNVTLC